MGSMDRLNRGRGHITQLMIAFIFTWGAIAAFVPPSLAIDIGSKLSGFQSGSQSMAMVNGSQSLDISSKLLVFVFWSFKCPVALSYNDRINGLQDKYFNKGVVVFGVASAANETQAEIRANIANLNLKVPVLLDAEGKFAELLGATHSPGVFVFDEDGILRYRGAMDNNKKVGENGRVAYVEDAIDAILAKRPVAPSETRLFGCSIRRHGVKE